VLPTGGKSVRQIVADVARAMRRAGLLKETPRAQKIKRGSKL